VHPSVGAMEDGSFSMSVVRKKIDGDGDGDREAPELWLVLQVALDDLCKACSAGDLDKVNEILERDRETTGGKLNVNSASTTTHETPLVCAVDGGNLEVVRLLLDRWADPNKQANDGITALHSAAGFGHMEITKYLLAKGAKPTKLDSDNESALDTATRFGHDKIVELFALAGTEHGLDDLKCEMIEGWAEKRKREQEMKQAQQDALDQKAKSEAREAARVAREARIGEELRQHQKQEKQRRDSMA